MPITISQSISVCPLTISFTIDDQHRVRNMTDEDALALGRAIQTAAVRHLDQDQPDPDVDR